MFRIQLNSDRNEGFLTKKMQFEPIINHTLPGTRFGCRGATLEFSPAQCAGKKFVTEKAIAEILRKSWLPLASACGRLKPMIIWHYTAALFAGLFLCNCIPHLACGLRGEAFPTPFSKPRGVGLSSALLNFFWGFFNLVAGLSLLAVSGISLGLNPGFILFLAGFAGLGASMARHFEAVRAGRKD